MRILLDTNLLTRMAEPGHSQHQPALDATILLGKQGNGLFLVPQILYEFWAVCIDVRQLKSPRVFVCTPAHPGR